MSKNLGNKLLVKIREIDQSLDEFEDALVSFLHVDETSLPASSELLLKLQPVEFIQPHQHLPRGWKFDSTIAILYPDLGEFSFFLGKEGRGFDGLDCCRLVERLSRAQPAPDLGVRQAS